jgi:lipopolysaccharide/colanic/teichoic acid biosynthesis glycosyltransferase
MDSRFYQRRGKREFDCVVATLGLALLAPIFVVVALLVKLSSPGPVFYFQDRVGLNGRRFKIVKFRSMFEDADKRGLAITSSSDRRITPIGRVIRSLKIDELPQLWNVLKGEMSLVGPRPEVLHYVESYSPEQRRVLTVRPGITDPATIAYRREQELLATQTDPDRYYRDVVLPNKLNRNLEYLDRISLSYDLFLVLLTTFSLFSSKLSLK